MKLDFVQTVAFGGVVLFVGYGIRRLVPVLSRYNIPAPVVGGMLLAIAIAALRGLGYAPPQFDNLLREPLQNAFFTTIGFGASVALLRVGGPLVIIYLVASVVLALLQNVVGAGIAVALGRHPLFGVLNGSVTLTGGPATGLAFAPRFEEAGVADAATIAVAAALVGIVSGGIIGGPIGTFFIERYRLRRPLASPVDVDVPTAENIVAERLPEPAAVAPHGEARESYALLKAAALILVAMAFGKPLGAWFTSVGYTLPSYIGAMMVAASIRNLDDLTGWLRPSQRVIDDIGTVALSLFLSIAIMTLELWRLASVATAMLVILLAQVVMIAVACIPMFRLMGRDYDSAVMNGGLCGFMLGTTANAMANMEALVEKYGPAPKAFLVVPIVGAFFIDFINALIINEFINRLS
jgi:glutamate:Na+ symporter, ESS family